MRPLLPTVFLASFLAFAISASGGGAFAAIDLDQVRGALPKKTESYLKEGLVTGGDREVRAGLIKNIRRAANAGFERIVIDFDSERAPYYQVAIESSESRILVTVFGGPRLGLNAKQVAASFKKSPVVSRVEFFPKVEEDSWTFALHLKNALPVEVFELTAPTRIIFDLKTGAPLATAPKKAKTRPQSAPVQSFEGNRGLPQSEEVPE